MCIPKETTEAGSTLHSKNITQKKENVDKNRKKTKGEKFRGMLEEKVYFLQCGHCFLISSSCVSFICQVRFSSDLYFFTGECNSKLDDRSNSSCLQFCMICPVVNLLQCSGGKLLELLIRAVFASFQFDQDTGQMNIYWHHLYVLRRTHDSM